MLKGNVPAVVSIVVSPYPIASTLPLDVTQFRTRVADSIQKWNSLAGASIHITSQNQGFLVHQSIPTSKIAYSLRYGNFGIDLVNGETFIEAAAGPRTVTRILGITYTGVPHSSLIEGDYTDVVTLAISAN